MKTKISVACKKAIEWQPCDLRNTNEKYSMYYAQGSSRGYMYVVGHVPKCMLVVLLCIKLILAKSMYTVCFLALTYIAMLLHWPMVITYFYLWVTRKFLSLFSTFMLGILNSWDQSIFVS